MENQFNDLDRLINFRNILKRNKSFYNEFNLLKKTLEVSILNLISNSINFLNDENDISRSLREKIKKLFVFGI
jgi:hypothetical protein